MSLCCVKLRTIYSMHIKGGRIDGDRIQFSHTCQLQQVRVYKHISHPILERASSDSSIGSSCFIIQRIPAWCVKVTARIVL
jgi:hypothetical protein